MVAGSGEMSMMPDMELEKGVVNVVKEEQEEKREEAMEEEEDEKKMKKKKLGGLRTMPFILGEFKFNSVVEFPHYYINLNFRKSL